MVEHQGWNGTKQEGEIEKTRKTVRNAFFFFFVFAQISHGVYGIA